MAFVMSQVIQVPFVVNQLTSSRSGSVRSPSQGSVGRMPGSNPARSLKIEANIYLQATLIKWWTRLVTVLWKITRINNFPLFFIRHGVVSTKCYDNFDTCSVHRFACCFTWWAWVLSLSLLQNHKKMKHCLAVGNFTPIRILVFCQSLHYKIYIAATKTG